MSTTIEIKVPDIGNVHDVDVVAVEVQTGDVIAVDQTLITLETDKASMDVPSSAAGTVQLSPTACWRLPPDSAPKHALSS